MTQTQLDLFTKLVLSGRRNPVTEKDFYNAFTSYSEAYDVLSKSSLNKFNITITFFFSQAKGIDIVTPAKEYRIAAHPVGDGFVVNIR
jgi:hypothetical protein